MKKFRDLFIVVKGELHDEFIRIVSSKISGHWSRDLARESEISNFGSDKMFCFNRAKNDGLDAKLWIVSDDKSRLKVSNIVPTEQTSLKFDDYNKILSEFYNFGIQDAAESLNGSSELTSDIFELEDVVESHIAKALRAFSSCANKSTGSSHPSDRQRWLDFIVNSYKANSQLELDELQKFLVNDGWSEDFAFDLSSEYESFLELLSFHEGK